MLFLDVENMGDAKVKSTINKVIEEFAPTYKEIVYSTAASLPRSFKDTFGWHVFRCEPGPNAADKIIQAHIKKAIANGAERIILVTSDCGFADVCKKVIAAGKRLCLIVRKLGKLAKKVMSNIDTHNRLKVFDVNLRQLSATDNGASVFVKDLAGVIHEIPFENGMRVSAFVDILKNNGLYRKHLAKWSREFFLEVRSGHVFVSKAVFA